MRIELTHSSLEEVETFSILRDALEELQRRVTMGDGDWYVYIVPEDVSSKKSHYDTIYFYDGDFYNFDLSGQTHGLGNTSDEAAHSYLSYRLSLLDQQPLKLTSDNRLYEITDCCGRVLLEDHIIFIDDSGTGYCPLCLGQEICDLLGLKH